MTHAKKTPAPDQVAIRHPGPWPLAFGAYATGITYLVDPDTAARLLARGFVRVTGAASTPAETMPASTLSPQDSVPED